MLLHVKLKQPKTIKNGINKISWKNMNQYNEILKEY
jgi:hypothetical protein